MNTKVNKQFKQAVLGGALAALTLGSMSAEAMRLSEAGEAQLVPFVLWDSNPLDSRRLSFLGINTAIKITVPKAVGNDVIPNFFTAFHTTPTNDPVCVENPEPVPLAAKGVLGCENPADAHINIVHWYFLDRNSKHLLNGKVPVTPEDVAVIDWGATIRQNGKQNELDGVPGYMVLVTEKATSGFFAADFSFFAEAWMFFGIDGPADIPNTGGVIGLVDALIPVLAMNDGADDPANLVPTLENSVIQLNQNSNFKVSPLATGIRTNWSDGVLGDTKVVDLTLGNRSIPIGGVINPFQVPTLMVIWNDRNAGGAWSGLGVEVYNDLEESCSDHIDLPYELNLYWVQTDVTAHGGRRMVANGEGVEREVEFRPWPVPRFIEDYGFDRTFCVPPTPGIDPVGNIERLLSGGFMKLYLPELVDGGINAPEAAMAAWSVPLQYFATLEQVDGFPPVLTDFSLIPFATALGHDRGMFNIAP